jgi:hypothetical protein
VEITGLKEARIRRHLIPSGEANDIAGDEVMPGDLTPDPIS